MYIVDSLSQIHFGSLVTLKRLFICFGVAAPRAIGEKRLPVRRVVAPDLGPSIWKPNPAFPKSLSFRCRLVILIWNRTPSTNCRRAWRDACPCIGKTSGNPESSSRSWSHCGYFCGFLGHSTPVDRLHLLSNIYLPLFEPPHSNRLKLFVVHDATVVALWIQFLYLKP